MARIKRRKKVLKKWTVMQSIIGFFSLLHTGQDCQMQKNNSILFEGSFFITRIQTKTKNRAVVLKCNSFIISIGSFLFFTLPFCNSSNLYDLKYWFSVVNDVFYKLPNKMLINRSLWHFSLCHFSSSIESRALF